MDNLSERGAGIVERLRDRRHMTQHSGLGAMLETCDQAAAHIEAQAVELERIYETCAMVCQSRADALAAIEGATAAVHVRIGELRAAASRIRALGAKP